MIVPKKLKDGSHIRVVAPARSLSLISAEGIAEATARYEKIGITLSFGAHVRERDAFVSSSVRSRVDDLHAAFSDESVDGILSVIGGYNSIQLLRSLDYELIKSNPKPLCGFSDITTLSNAIYTKTGVIGYSGPHFSTFGMRKGLEYTLDAFKACLFNSAPFVLTPSHEWSDDLWFLDQEKRNFISNDGFWLLNDVRGVRSGTIVGGHLRCFNALQGTEYCPNLEGAILFIEEDAEINAQLFDRQLQSIIYQRGFEEVTAVLIGRFQKASGIDRTMLSQIVASKPELRNIPVIANIDFGHTTPIITYPIGGTCEVRVEGGQPRITIQAH